MSDTTTTPTPLHSRWGQKIEALRRELNLTQDDLAEKTPTSQQTISRIELGRQVPSDGLRVKIARALGVKVADIFTYEEDDHA